MTVPVIPESATHAELVRYVREIANAVRLLEARYLDNTSGWAGNQSNVTADRTYDADASSTAELADVLGTLISDLINVGVLR